MTVISGCIQSFLRICLIGENWTETRFEAGRKRVHPSVIKVSQFRPLHSSFLHPLRQPFSHLTSSSTLNGQMVDPARKWALAGMSQPHSRALLFLFLPQGQHLLPPWHCHSSRHYPSVFQHQAQGSIWDPRAQREAKFSNFRGRGFLGDPLSSLIRLDLIFQLPVLPHQPPPSP